MPKSVLVITPNLALAAWVQVCLHESGLEISHVEALPQARSSAHRPDALVLDGESVNPVAEVELFDLAQRLAPAAGLIIGGESAFPAQLEQLGWLKLPYPSYPLALVDALARLLAEPGLLSERITAWLAQNLQLTSADAAVVLRGQQLVASAGALALQAVQEAAALLGSSTGGGRGDIIRYAHLAAEPGNRLLYSRYFNIEDLLTLIYPSDTPLSLPRDQIGLLLQASGLQPTSAEQLQQQLARHQNSSSDPQSN